MLHEVGCAGVKQTPLFAVSDNPGFCCSGTNEGLDTSIQIEDISDIQALNMIEASKQNEHFIV